MKTGKIRHAGNRVRQLLYQGITVKIMPPSAERVIDLHVSFIQVTFLGLLFLGLVIGVIFMAAGLANTGGKSHQLGASLSTAQANYDSVSDEVRNLLQTYDVFNAALGSAISEIAVSSQALPTDSNLDRVRDIPELAKSLSGAIKPLQETMVVMRTQKKILSDIPNVWPVEGGGELSMEFGPNVHPIRKIWYIHKGVDIAASSGLAVVAAANGRVVEVKYDEVSGYGRTILLEHKFGFMTRYAHLGAQFVQEGDEVVQGQRIGTLGNSGLSTGAHVHFEIILGNQVLDPVSFLKISNNFKRWTGDRPNTWE